MLSAFYRDVLGLPELRRWHADDDTVRSVWLDLGGPVLMIERTSARREPVSGVGAGLFLLALAMPTQRRATIVEELAANGVIVESETEFSVYFRDPDGNRVALSAYPIER